MEFLRDWWNAPDRYEWKRAYAASLPGAVPFVRLFMIAGTIVGGLSTVVIQWSPAGPHSTSGQIVTVTAGIVGAAPAVLWMRPTLPGTRVSIGFVFVGTCAIAVACLGGIAPLLAQVACTYFAMICGYAAFAHSMRLLAFTIAVAIGTLTVATVRAVGDDPALALIQLVYVSAVVLVVPLSAHWWTLRLGLDAVNSRTDPLTGLLNRRGFEIGIVELIDQHARSLDHHLVVAMIDLDKFKRLNDTEGHDRGDKALIDIADTLRRHVRRDAIVARIGGEEFLVAFITADTDAVTVMANRLREAIVETPPRLSASIGLATEPMSTIARESDIGVDNLVRRADAAMYVAKRAGGNQFSIHQPDALF